MKHSLLILHFSISFAVGFLLFSVATARGAIIATPGSGTGGYYAYEPFGLVESGLASCRYQQVYEASEFASDLPGGGVITGLIFVSDFSFGHGFNAILPDIQIDMAISPRGPDQLSTVFLENIGGSLTTVLRGSLALTAQADGRGLPVSITLTTPFFYNPATGNLLLDIRNVAGIPNPNIPLTRVGPLNASNNEFGPDTVSRVFAHDVNATSGTADSLGLTTFFVVTPVPEPSSVAFFFIALGVAGFWHFRNRRIRKP